MAEIKTITMSMRELDRLKTIAQGADGSLCASVAAAALRLQLTKRQVNRLVKRYRDEGHAGVMSRHLAWRPRLGAPARRPRLGAPG